jgi:hypothetical protein
VFRKPVKIQSSENESFRAFSSLHFGVPKLLILETLCGMVLRRIGGRDHDQGTEGDGGGQ